MDSNNIKNVKIALSGGGIKSIAHLGFLKFLFENKMIPSQISAVSGGSIIAGIYAVEFDKSIESGNPPLTAMYKAYLRLNEIAMNITASKFKDIDYFIIFKSIFDQSAFSFGFINGNKLHDFALKETYNLTFSDLKHVELFITATEMSSGLLTVFSKHTTPNVKIGDAIRSSCSIQGAFKPFRMPYVKLLNAVFYNNSFYSTPLTESELVLRCPDGLNLYLIDGGNLGNCRTDILVMYNDPIPTIGLSLTYCNYPKLNTSMFSLFNHTIEIMMSAQEGLMDSISTRDIVLRFPTTVDSLDFDIPVIKRQQLIDECYRFCNYNKRKIMRLFD